MSKRDLNIKEIKEYLTAGFPGSDIVSVDIKGLMPDRPDQFFYGFQVEGKYFLAIVRAMVEEETAYPVLEGKNIAQQMKSHPHSCVVMEKGRFGKGTEVHIEKLSG